ncbi:FecR family protein [Thalassobellus citreus]|uniref:FecR family protein n=1 Tax=Thalassobellus citreus TaxID=3367752 RepID=UPI0037B456CA
MKKIILKYLTDTINNEELIALRDWLKKSENQEVFKSYIKDAYSVNRLHVEPNTEEAYNIVLDKILNKTTPVPVKKIHPFWMKYAAAILVVGFLLTGYLFKDSIFSSNDIITVDNTNTIKIGTDKAILILENGSEIALEKGKAQTSENFTTDGKELVYKKAASKNKPEIAYNYLEIPRGGQFSLKLSDGTKVWLNSESKIKYPESFISGQSREVVLLYGEAYFEVTPSSENNGDRFVVQSKGQEIEVIGTKFNINTYKDNIVRSTLVEGRINLKANHSEQKIFPGQQAVFNIEKQTVNIHYADDVESEISWIHGVFSFKEKNFEDIMTVLGRWYNVDVEYLNAQVKQVKFTGILSKDQSLENILSIMETTTTMTYEIKNNTILVK